MRVRDMKLMVEHLRSAVAEYILGGSFDLKFFGDYHTKPGDNGYLPRSVESGEEEVEIHCLGEITISIVAPRDVRVHARGLRVLDADRVTVTRHQRAGGEGTLFSAWVDGDAVVADVSAPGWPVSLVKMPRDVLTQPIFELVRVE